MACSLFQYLPGAFKTYHIGLELVGGFNPSEKYESQLGWLFPIYGKIFQTTNQWNMLKQWGWKPILLPLHTVYQDLARYSILTVDHFTKLRLTNNSQLSTSNGTLCKSRHSLGASISHVRTHMFAGWLKQHTSKIILAQRVENWSTHIDIPMAGDWSWFCKQQPQDDDD